MISVICKCGKEFFTQEYRIKNNRGKFCSINCKRKYAIRPKGLKYNLVKENPTSFKKGFVPWNKGNAKPVYDKSIGYMKIKGRKYHRVLMEQKIGRKLLKREVVHHIDGNKLNNDINNLELFSSKSEHLRFHLKTNRRTSE